MRDIKVSNRQYDDILVFIRKGENMNAIKYLREELGRANYSLIDIKRAVERMSHTYGFMKESPHEEALWISPYNLKPNFLSASIPVCVGLTPDTVNVSTVGDGRVNIQLPSHDLMISVEVLKSILKMVDNFHSLGE